MSCFATYFYCTRGNHWAHAHRWRKHQGQMLCRDCHAAHQREYRRRNVAKFRDHDLRRTYGISLDERNAMLAEQGDKCAVCRSTTPGKRDWCVDHDHNTGAIRGILCGQCNVGIGCLGDTVEGLRAAVAYLERSQVA